MDNARIAGVIVKYFPYTAECATSFPLILYIPNSVIWLRQSFVQGIVLRMIENAQGDSASCVPQVFDHLHLSFLEKILC